MTEYEVPKLAKIVYWMAVLLLCAIAIFVVSLFRPGDYRIFIWFSVASSLSGIAIWFPDFIDKYLWHHPVVNFFLRIPDFRGRWVGTITSHLSGETHAFVMEIQQVGSKLTMETYTAAPSGATIVNEGSILLVGDNAKPVILVPFTATTDNKNGPGRIHRGMHRGVLLQPHQMTGEYINSRPRNEGSPGATGVWALKWESLKCTSAL